MGYSLKSWTQLSDEAHMGALKGGSSLGLDCELVNRSVNSSSSMKEVTDLVNSAQNLNKSA